MASPRRPCRSTGESETAHSDNEANRLYSRTQAAATALARRLEGLGKLHADGVLTDEEFAAAKRRLLET